MEQEIEELFIQWYLNNDPCHWGIHESVEFAISKIDAEAIEWKAFRDGYTEGEADGYWVGGCDGYREGILAS